MKILITGGPVHGKLDAVKIITNKFKGGLIAKLAENLFDLTQAFQPAEIIYLTAKGCKLPQRDNINIIYHDGFFDYQKQVLELAPKMDAIILGGAIANLIPEKPWEGKFPSHNYNPGDIVNIPFIITPRVIEQVKSVAPKTRLFGFKLLSDVSHEELIDVAYETVLASKADIIFANDATNLKTKFAVTKEKSVIELGLNEYPQFILNTINNKNYKTNLTKMDFNSIKNIDIEEEALMGFYINDYQDKFKVTGKINYIFGTVAVKNDDGSFITTIRGKHELQGRTVVNKVDHENKVVYVTGPSKATLNAPLLAKIFEDPRVKIIIHYHEQIDNLPTLNYAAPGTVKDSIRDINGSFNIKYHGCFLLFDDAGVQL